MSTAFGKLTMPGFLQHKLFEIDPVWCAQTRMDSNRQLGIREGHKTAKESKAYTLARTASRGGRRIKSTIMNRSV